MREITTEYLFKYIASKERELREKYPHGRAYDNIFNAEHRDLVVEIKGFTEAMNIKIEDLARSV